MGSASSFLHSRPSPIKVVVEPKKRKKSNDLNQSHGEGKQNSQSSFHLDSIRRNPTTDKKIPPLTNIPSLNRVRGLVHQSSSRIGEMFRWSSNISKDSMKSTERQSGQNSGVAYVNSSGQIATIRPENYWKISNIIQSSRKLRAVDVDGSSVGGAANMVSMVQRLDESNSRSIIESRQSSVHTTLSSNVQWSKTCNYCQMTFYTKSDYSDHVNVSLLNIP